MIFQIIYIFFYAIYSYFHLFFRKIIPRSPKSLDGEVFLITGAASGIGKEVVLYLAKHHPRTKLVLWDWNEAQNRETADGAKLLGVQAWSYQVDVTDRRQVDETAKRVLDDVGIVTILFNNAGIITMEEVLPASPEKIEKTIAVNLTSHFWTIKAFVPGMIQADHGHIVTTSSVSAYQGMRYDAPYSATKYAIRGYLEGFKSELRHHPLQPKINFTTIFPYFISTPLINRLRLKTKMSKAFLDARFVAKRIIQGVCRNEENIFLPSHLEFLIFFKRYPKKYFSEIYFANALDSLKAKHFCFPHSFLPSRVWYKIEDFLIEDIQFAKA